MAAVRIIGQPPRRCQVFIHCVNCQCIGFGQGLAWACPGPLILKKQNKERERERERERETPSLKRKGVSLFFIDNRIWFAAGLARAWLRLGQGSQARP